LLHWAGVLGISPRLQFDESYRCFFELATAQVVTAITNARAHQEERKRAEALAELDREKTAIFRNVSHEFRTPLTLSLGPLEEVLSGARGPLRTEQRSELEVAHRNSLRLLRLVNALLDFSWIEAGRMQAADDYLIKPFAARELLARVSTHLELSKVRAEAERLATVLRTIDAAATRMGAEIDGLLDVTRVSLGRTLELERESTDLVALVRRVAAEQQVSSDTHQIAVSSDTPELHGDWDRGRVERAVANLLTNAIKYSPDGGPISVTISREDDASGTFAVLSVVDRGVGIPAADLPHVFEHFRRASNVPGSVPGTGMGLAAVHQIVEQHGGTVSVTSRVGEGSTFVIRLPLAATS
jgi:signal transduction histidine kinase